MTTVLQNFFDLASESQPITAIPNSVGRQGDLHVRERTHAMHSLLYILLNANKHWPQLCTQDRVVKRESASLLLDSVGEQETAM